MGLSTKQKILFQILKQYEETYSTFTFEELAQKSGYTLSSIGTYHRKNLRRNFVTDDNNKMRVTGIKHLSEDEFLSIMSQVKNKDPQYGIKRSIEFPPEYHQAGISILNHFGTVLRQKFPEKKARVRIEQEDLKVTMIVETEKDNVERFEKALNDYGLVAIGKLTPEEFLSDPFQVAMLKNKLEHTKAELNSSRTLMALQANQFGEKMELLKHRAVESENQIATLRTQIERAGEHTENQFETFAQLLGKVLNTSDRNADKADAAHIAHIKTLKEQNVGIKEELSLIIHKLGIENPSEDDKEEVRATIEKIKDKEPGYKQIFSEYMLGASSSVMGSFLIQVLRALP